MPRNYKDFLQRYWRARNASLRKQGLSLLPEPDYDPLDDEESYKTFDEIDFTTGVRPQYVRSVAMQAGVVVMNEMEVRNFNLALGERSTANRNWSVLDMVCDDDEMDVDDESIRGRLVQVINAAFHQLLHPQQANLANPTLKELSFKALSFASNFCDILRRKGMFAFRVSECTSLWQSITQQENGHGQLPRRASPFASILTPLNKLLIFKAFYVADFGDHHEVRSFEHLLQTKWYSTLHSSDTLRLLSQMYYLQPANVTRTEREFCVHWG